MANAKAKHSSLMFDSKYEKSVEHTKSSYVNDVLFAMSVLVPFPLYHKYNTMVTTYSASVQNLYMAVKIWNFCFHRVLPLVTLNLVCFIYAESSCTLQVWRAYVK